MTGPAPGSAEPPVPLERIRLLILANPQQAVRYLDAQTGVSAWPAALTHTLLAEAHLHAGNSQQAYEHALTAASIPGTTRRDGLAACAVLADLSCWTGRSDAAETCAMYRDLADHAGETDRAVCAQALHAVTVFQHQSCGRGRDELADLTRAAATGSALLAMLHNAAAVMADSCRTGRHPIEDTGWAPTPGGYLCPADQPSPAYLTSRLARHRGTHLCRDDASQPSPEQTPDKALP